MWGKDRKSVGQSRVWGLASLERIGSKKGWELLVGRDRNSVGHSRVWGLASLERVG